LSSSPKPVYLRPSQLMLGSIESPQQGTSQSPSPLKPPSLGNPFARGKFVQSFLISNVKTVQNTYSLLFWFHCMSYPLNSPIFSSITIYIFWESLCIPTSMCLLTRNSADQQSIIFSEVNMIVHLFLTVWLLQLCPAVHIL
jgi:hypothetical protein